MQFHIKNKSVVKLNRCLLLLLCLSMLFFTGSWGFLVHRTVHQVSVYQLPKQMQRFFYKNIDYLVQHSVRPDLRRNADSTEAPKHFIDLEAFGDSAAWKMPPGWNEAIAKYSADSLEKYGYVPYWIVTMKEKLTNAFRSGNRDSILFYAADIGHYIEDANVPLHTSINYDGQLTGQRGLHALWESTIPELEINHYNLYSSHKAIYLPDPAQAIWAAIRRAYILLPDVFQQEKEASRLFTDSTKFNVQMRNGRQVKRYSSAFAREYSKRLGTTINQQLLRSANLCADFWYTSWVDAGKPDLNVLLQSTFSKADKKKLKKEIKAYRRNQLLKQKHLIATKFKEENF
ncbi:MAG: zinc dependent phospholipase C family protein [Chitinophagaceae bacterium]